MKKNEILSNIIITQILPNYNIYKNKGFIISLEDNHLIIEFRNNKYKLTIKNSSLYLFRNNELLKDFYNFEDVIKYLYKI